MSMILMVAAMKAKIGNPIRKLVLIKLADNANDDGICWPSYRHIADHCEVDRKTVIRHIQWLEDNRFLSKQYRKDDERGNKSNVYRVDIAGGIAHLGSQNPYPSTTESPAPRVIESPRTSHSFEPTNEPVNIMSPTGSACSVCGGSGNGCDEPMCLRCKGTGQEPTCNAGLPVDNSELTTEQPTKADKALNVPFEDFWNLYNKKVGRKKAESRWKRLSNKDRAAIMEHLPNYIRNTPDVTYRKNPETYLNAESWNDELPNMRKPGRPEYPENQGVDKSIHISQMNPAKPGLRYGEEAQFATVLTDEHKAKNEEMRGRLADMLKGFEE